MGKSEQGSLAGFATDELERELRRRKKAAWVPELVGLDSFDFVVELRRFSENEKDRLSNPDYEPPVNFYDALGELVIERLYGTDGAAWWRQNLAK